MRNELNEYFTIQISHNLNSFCKLKRTGYNNYFNLFYGLAYSVRLNLIKKNA